MNFVAVALFLYAVESCYINARLGLYPSAIIDGIIMIFSIFFAFYTKTIRSD